MKELSIEEKAKAYDSMFERLKEMYNNNKTNVAARLVYERYFPELTESEDKGVCGKLIAFLKQSKAVYGDGFKQFDLNIDDAIAWLEKQGEKEKFIKKELECIRGYRDEAIRRLNELEQQGEQKKYPQSVIDNAISFLSLRNDGMPIEEAKDIVNAIITVLNPSYWPKQGEQKPVKVPKFKVGDFIQFNGMGHTRYTIKEVCGLSHYINTCNKRMDMSYTDANFELVEQKPAWSEADKRNINELLYIVEANYLSSEEPHDRLINFLESLKERVVPQLRQEWSEEDEDAIGMAIIALEDMYDPDEPNNTYAGYTMPFNKAALRLRVLKDRKTWKPSEEYIDLINEAIGFFGAHSAKGMLMMDLRNNIKKLREEDV